MLIRPGSYCAKPARIILCQTGPDHIWLWMATSGCGQTDPFWKQAGVQESSEEEEEEEEKRRKKEEEEEDSTTNTNNRNHHHNATVLMLGMTIYICTPVLFEISSVCAGHDASKPRLGAPTSKQSSARVWDHFQKTKSRMRYIIVKSDVLRPVTS